MSRCAAEAVHRIGVYYLLALLLLNRWLGNFLLGIYPLCCEHVGGCLFLLEDSGIFQADFPCFFGLSWWRWTRFTSDLGTLFLKIRVMHNPRGCPFVSLFFVCACLPC